jgi:flagellar biosynthesis GTPase FlhF
MKIKRFEASTMSEALRMIKKEFGEDAVILSAKTQKKSSGLLGGKRPQKVVVTAAIDQSVPGASDVSPRGALQGCIRLFLSISGYRQGFLKVQLP